MKFTQSLLALSILSALGPVGCQSSRKSRDVAAAPGEPTTAETTEIVAAPVEEIKSVVESETATVAEASAEVNNNPFLKVVATGTTIIIVTSAVLVAKFHKKGYDNWLTNTIRGLEKKRAQLPLNSKEIAKIDEALKVKNIEGFLGIKKATGIVWESIVVGISNTGAKGAALTQSVKNKVVDMWAAVLETVTSTNKTFAKSPMQETINSIAEQQAKLIKTAAAK